MKQNSQKSPLLVWVISIILIIFITLFAVSYYAFYSAIHPNKVVSKETPLKYGYAYEDVEFKSTDGITLRGWLIPNKNSNKSRRI